MKNTNTLERKTMCNNFGKVVEYYDAALVDARITELESALREACGWDWLSHAEAVEGGNQDGQIPFTVQEQIKKALD